MGVIEAIAVTVLGLVVIVVVMNIGKSRIFQAVVYWAIVLGALAVLLFIAYFIGSLIVIIVRDGILQAASDSLVPVVDGQTVG